MTATTTMIPMEDFYKSNRKLPYPQFAYGTNPVGVCVFADLKKYEKVAFCIDWKNQETEQVIIPLDCLFEAKENGIKFPMEMERSEYRSRKKSKSDVNGSLHHMYEIMFSAKAVRERSTFEFKIDYFCALGDPRTPSGRKSRAKVKALDLTFNLLPEFTLLKPKRTWLDRLLKREPLWVNPIVCGGALETLDIPKKEGA